jgi:hypothetical protein
LTGIACGGAAATASCLQPESDRLKIAQAAIEKTNLVFEDLISDKVFLLTKLHNCISRDCHPRKIGRG